MAETEKDTGHIDLTGSIGGVDMFLGHGDIQITGDHESQYRVLSTFLMKIAWELEERADRFRNFQPRCYRNQVGDLWFEVSPDLFIDAEDPAHAQDLFAAGTPTILYETLKTYYPEIEEVL